MKYKQLSLEERERIAILLAKGYSSRKIASVLGRSHRTINRELRRNAPYGQEYIPCKAQKRYEKRTRKQRRRAPLKSPEILLYVRKMLREKQWSPETIAARLQMETGLSLHHETIYRYIYHKDNRKYQLWNYLTLKRKRRQKKYGRSSRRANRIKNGISIDLRPIEVEERKEYGHWETDLMEGPRQTKATLQVNVERKYRYIKITKLKDKSSQTNSTNMVRLLKRYKPESITSDNGSENAKHEEVSEKLNTKHYFCHPYSSWEKGSVENRIGVIRRYIPKGVDISKFSHKEIRQIEEAINNRPLKCLNWLSPIECMRKDGVL